MFDAQVYINGNELFDGHYRLLRLLSTEGGTADVWLAENYESVETEFSVETDDVVRVEGTGILVAIKIYRPKNVLDVDGEQTFRKEFKTIFNCHHANLLPTTDYSIFDGNPYLVMPYCEHGSVEKMVGKMDKVDDIWKFIFDTASGLDYLHRCSSPIIHQDIKPSNILIDVNGNYCITDFGISVKSDGEERDDNNEYSGTTIYMPPERFKDDYTAIPKSDIWSLGATVYELITGDVPFGNDGGEAQLNGTKKVPPIKKNLPKSLKNLIYECLDLNPDNRPTAQQVAELAKTRGKGQKMQMAIICTVSIVAASIISAVLIIPPPHPSPLPPFDIFCGKGDSVVNLQKNELRSTQLLDTVIVTQRLIEAKKMYKQAKSHRTNNRERFDSICRRIEVINELLVDMLVYKGAFDSLQMAIADEMDTQKEIYNTRTRVLSKNMKDKIQRL